MAPTRKEEIAKLGLKAMLTGALTNMLTAIIAGMLI